MIPLTFCLGLRLRGGFNGFHGQQNLNGPLEVGNHIFHRELLVIQPLTELHDVIYLLPVALWLLWDKTEKHMVLIRSNVPLISIRKSHRAAKDLMVHAILESPWSHCGGPFQEDGSSHQSSLRTPAVDRSMVGKKKNLVKSPRPICPTGPYIS